MENKFVWGGENTTSYGYMVFGLFTSFHLTREMFTALNIIRPRFDHDKTRLPMSSCNVCRIHSSMPKLIIPSSNLGEHAAVC